MAWIWSWLLVFLNFVIFENPNLGSLAPIEVKILVARGSGNKIVAKSGINAY